MVNLPFTTCLRYAGVMIGRGILALAAAGAALTAATPASACAPVTVYFNWNSAELSDESKAALERLAVTLAWKGPDLAHLLLTSHTDSTGSPAANRAIALKRAEAVRRALVSYSVPENLILIQPVGEHQPRVATPRNVREPRNRRVELLIQMSAEAQARHLREGRAIC
jgi:outer membrane protein OmpA-like peptidoglycan-associated protein